MTILFITRVTLLDQLCFYLTATPYVAFLLTIIYYLKLQIGKDPQLHLYKTPLPEKKLIAEHKVSIEKHTAELSSPECNSEHTVSQKEKVEYSIRDLKNKIEALQSSVLTRMHSKRKKETMLIFSATTFICSFTLNTLLAVWISLMDQQPIIETFQFIFMLIFEKMPRILNHEFYMILGVLMGSSLFMGLYQAIIRNNKKLEQISKETLE